MEDSAIISGEFAHFKHIKTRKVVVLEIEIPEEMFQDAISKLGMPIGGESKPVAVALLNKSDICRHSQVAPSPDIGISISEKSEGERLRVLAIMRCKDAVFQQFCHELYSFNQNELGAKALITHYCHINSRSELTTNEEAQRLFYELECKYKDWLFEQQHADNLGRI